VAGTPRPKGNLAHLLVKLQGHPGFAIGMLNDAENLETAAALRISCEIRMRIMIRVK
jgi:hypothetical protein